MDLLFDKGQIYLFILWVLVLLESFQRYSRYKKIIMKTY